jgi:hypothetical protein
MNTQPIQFLLYQLANNEQDRERFNKITMELYVEPNGTCWNPLFGKAKIENLHDQQVVNFIRTCLSRVNGEAVLIGFDQWDKGMIEKRRLQKEIAKEMENNQMMSLGIISIYRNEFESIKLLTDDLYETFDYPLRNGKPLDEALSALHNKMLQLVPEYVEFINNNK